MKWTFRWYGQDDPFPANYIRQIPQVKGVVGTLIDKLPGEVWEVEEINNLKKLAKKSDLELYGIESVSVHDSIKAGAKDRDYYINNYKESIKNLGECGVKVICYSFKPIFGWLKTDLNYRFNDDSIGLLYDQSTVDTLKASEMFNYVKKQSGDFNLSGWEEDRLKKFNTLVSLYEGITEEKLFENYKYFIENIIDTLEESDVYMAIHPDDPPWEIFNYPRITKNLHDLKKLLSISDSRHHGLTLCTGSLGANPQNDLVEIINELGDRINFVHFRNIQLLNEKKFVETAHYSLEGSLDMSSIMKALIKNNYDGLIRPDHGRTIWGENARPGYGLYDRALGITYMQGLHEALIKNI